MNRNLACALALALPLAAQAAQAAPLPPRMTGAFHGMLANDPRQQVDLVLDPDGIGMMVGSVEATPMPGTVHEPGEPMPRALIGFGVRAVLEGDTLTLYPFYPGITPDKLAEVTKHPFVCRLGSAGEAMTCIGPDGVPNVVTRRSAAPSAQEAGQIALLRDQAPRP